MELWLGQSDKVSTTNLPHHLRVSQTQRRVQTPILDAMAHARFLGAHVQQHFRRTHSTPMMMMMMMMRMYMPAGTSRRITRACHWHGMVIKFLAHSSHITKHISQHPPPLLIIPGLLETPIDNFALCSDCVSRVTIPNTYRTWSNIKGVALPQPHLYTHSNAYTRILRSAIRTTQHITTHKNNQTSNQTTKRRNSVVNSCQSLNRTPAICF